MVEVIAVGVLIFLLTGYIWITNEHIEAQSEKILMAIQNTGQFPQLTTKGSTPKKTGKKSGGKARGC